MSILQRFFTAILPASWARSLEADSRDWVLRCRCSYEQSIWDLGGIRWKAKGNSKSLRRCPSCGQVTWHTMIKTSDEARRQANSTD